MKKESDSTSSTPITVELVETKETAIQVVASSPEEAFQKARNGEGEKMGSTQKSEYVIRDYPEETTLDGADGSGLN